MRPCTPPTSVLILLILCATARAEPGRIRGPISPGREIVQTRKYILEKGQRRLDLGRPFIIPGSDSITVDGKPLVRGSDYRINTLRGTLIIVRPAEGGEELVARFSRFPLSFSPVFASRFPEGKQDFQPTWKPSEPSSRKKASSSGVSRLRLSGSKTVGFSVGSNRELGIDQSLKVSMAGKIAKDLEVEAFLTDDNLPVQPEGNTEELKHLDKVSVQVRGKNFEVQLGDFTTGLEWSRFSSFQRELLGATASVGVGGQTFFAGGGMAKGRFQTVNFMGREGVQGPYELLPARRLNAVVILPGTEDVYLDGRLLKRGSENDYTIDYNRGAVTFTEKIAVTDDSEIVIDFQMGEDNYERTTVTAGWTSQMLGDAAQLRVFFFQESDDYGKPLRGGLSTEELSLLEIAGDDPDSAMASGIEKVEEGKGNYIYEADSIPARFVFVESGGDYRLDFYEVGAGKGDYRIDGFSTRGEVKYAHVGEGKGDFVIGRPLPLPESKRLLTVDTRIERGSLFFDAEGNLSQYDRNTLSGLDDQDNTGGAVRFEGGLKELHIRSTRLSLAGEFSVLQDRFKSPDKPRDSYFYRNWNLEDMPLRGRESIAGTKVRLQGEGAWDVEGSFRYLSRGPELSAGKGELAASFGDMVYRGLSIKALESRVGEERDRRFVRGEGVLALWHIVPRLAIEAERYRSFVPASPDTGRLYRQGVVSLGGRKIGGFRGEITYSHRHTDNLDASGAEWVQARENDQIGLEGGYTGGGRILDIFLTHRRNRDLRSGTTGWYDLGRFRYRDTWESISATTDIGYRIGSGEERRQDRAVVFVGENQGDYDSEGREVGQKRGDYMLLYLPGSEKEAVRTVEFSWRLSVGKGLRGLGDDAGGGGWTAKIRRNVSCDHFFSVMEKSRTDDLARFYMLSPSLLQRDDVTLYGVNKLRQEWSFLDAVKRYNLRLTLSREDEEDNRSAGMRAERYSRGVSIRAEAAPYSSLNFSLEGGTKLRVRDSGGAFDQKYRVESFTAAHILSYRPRTSTRLSLEIGFEKRLDEVSSASQTSLQTTPSFISSVGDHLNLTAFIKFTYTKADVDEGKPLFFLEEGMREDWNLAGQYRFTRNVSFGVNYTGRREKDFLGEVKTIHDLKVESRAYF